jgi:hypothetical protein
MRKSTATTNDVALQELMNTRIPSLIMADGNAVYFNPQFNGAADPIDVFIVLIGMWSDGTPAPTNGQ